MRERINGNEHITLATYHVLVTDYFTTLSYVPCTHLCLACAGHGELVVLTQLVHAQNGNDVLQTYGGQRGGKRGGRREWEGWW